MAKSDEPPYTLEIDLNVLNHLGLNLYSNVPAVLSELVANAWDADAGSVKITIDEFEEGKTITIRDDGCGMSRDDLDEKFLTVGYQRRTREEDDLTLEKKRKIMGRKGIGKLSVFSIAEYIQVFTRKENEKILGLELDLQSIKRAIKNKTSYHPKSLEFQAEYAINNHGTIIVLKRIKKRVNSTLDRNLRKRVARRFDVIDDDFKVSIDGEKITIEDRDYFRKLEYALIYGDFDTTKFQPGMKYKERKNITEGGYSITGWIGLMRKSGLLQDSGDNLNKISIRSRGRIAMEDILDRFREGGLYTKYVMGEIGANFLDETTKEDIATSGRQDFVQSDQRFQELENFIQDEIKYLCKERERIKNEEGVAKASEIPAIKEWYKSLKGDTQKAAKNLFGKINEIATDEEHRKTLLKYGVLAFEHLHHKEKLSELEKLDIHDLSAAVQLFLELDDIEASWYYQITKGRLEVIEKLAKYLKSNALERILQEHIYNHLWLLDPSWDRATETATMEKTVVSAFKDISESLTDEEKKGRIDIRYKKITGKHVIIELKRGSIITSTSELMGQVDKYIQALRKQLETANAKGVAIEAICLVGKELSDWENPERRQRSENSLGAQNIRVVTYQQLLKDAETNYQSYLDKHEERGRIQKLLDAIEEYNGVDMPGSVIRSQYEVASNHLGNEASG